MRPLTLYRHNWPTTITEKQLVQGLGLRRRLLDARLEKDDPLKVLQCLVRKGFGLKNFVLALRATGGCLRATTSKRYYCIPSKMARAKGGQQGFVVPRAIFHGASESALRRFCQIPHDELSAALHRQIGLARSLTFQDCLVMLEATAMLSPVPPILQAAANFVVDLPYPEGLLREEAPDPIRRVSHAARYPQFHRILSLLHKVRNRDVTPEQFAEILRSEDPANITDPDDQLLVRIARFYAYQYVPQAATFRAKFADRFGLMQPPGRKRKTSTGSTHHRMMQELPRALALYRDGIIPKKPAPVLRQVVRIIWASEIVELCAKGEDWILSPGTRLMPRRKLYDPFEIRQMYGLGSGTDDADDVFVQSGPLKDAAIRVMCLLLADCWQRHCSIVSVELQHFAMGINYQELRIVRSKNGPANQAIPLWALLSPTDLQFLRKFLDRCQAEYPNDKTRRLTEVAGIGRFDCSQFQVAQKAFVRELRTKNPNFCDVTHLPRVTGLSWAPIRALAAFRPDIMSHPEISNLSSHPWFTEEALGRFRQLLGSKATDSLEIYRRIACWSTPEQFVKTYWRLSHLYLDLHLYLSPGNRH